MTTSHFSWTLGCMLFVFGKHNAMSQGSFGNLDFESPNLPLTPVNFQVPISDALPGWVGYIGGNPWGLVVYNTVSLGDAAITLQGPGSTRPILQGSYTVFLQPQFPSGSPVPSIAQTGTVPASAQSIRFYSSYVGTSRPGFVSFAGVTIPASLIENTPNYAIYGGDISAFANQSGELRFTGGGYLDNIFFSNQAIPEPSALSLLALGSLFLLRQRRKKFGW